MSAADTPAETKSAPEPREITSEELFGEARLVVIRHGEETYRLLVTRNNRLILQK
ncbi:MAG: hemin uptake protein HemP [Pirellulales bacterium]|nr:hemin uptake protein HemP [Pirellulales bacterium]MBX3433406.1 hemin uptake protein HemP [Pirellulales bacterium]